MFICYVEVGTGKAVLFYRHKWNYMYMCTMKVCDISPFAVLLFLVCDNLDVTWMLLVGHTAQLIKCQAMGCMDSSGFLIWALWFFSLHSVHDGSEYENWKLYFTPVHCHCCHGLSRCQNWNFAVIVTWRLFILKISFNNTLLSSGNNGNCNSLGIAVEQF